MRWQETYIYTNIYAGGKGERERKKKLVVCVFIIILY
jgi:hypothetical protein